MSSTNSITAIASETSVSNSTTTVASVSSVSNTTTSATSVTRVGNSTIVTTSEMSAANSTMLASSETSFRNSTTVASSETSPAISTIAATSETSTAISTIAATSETSTANLTIAATSETSIANSTIAATSETSIANSTIAATSETSIANSTIAATSETSIANSSMTSPFETSVAITNTTTVSDASRDDQSVITALPTLPIHNITQEATTAVETRNTTFVTAPTSPRGTFLTTDHVHSTGNIADEKTTVFTDASSTSSPPLSPNNTDYSELISKSTLPAARPSSTDVFQSEKLRLNGKVHDLNEQVQSLTIALAVVSVVLGIIILIFIIYRLVIYLRGRGKSPSHVIDDLDGKPEKKRAQVSYFRPQSNYYDIGDKDDNPSVSFSNETTPGKVDPLVTFNLRGIPLTTSETDSSSREPKESHDTDSIYRTRANGKEGKLSDAPNNNQAAHRNKREDNAFVEINLV